jgi:hypothetical protein
MRKMPSGCIPEILRHRPNARSATVREEFSVFIVVHGVESFHVDDKIAWGSETEALERVAWT